MNIVLWWHTVGTDQSIMLLKYTAALYPCCCKMPQNPLWSCTITSLSPFYQSALNTHCWLLIFPLSSLISSVSYFLCLHLSSHLSPIFTLLLILFHTFNFGYHCITLPPPSPHLPPDKQSQSPACTLVGYRGRERSLVSSIRRRGMMRESGALSGWHNVTE